MSESWTYNASAGTRFQPAGGLRPLGPMVGCFLFRLGCHFLMLDRERTVVRGHFPVMLSRNRVRRLFGPLVEHSGTLNQIFGVRHGDTSLPTNLCKRRAQARAVRSGFK